MKGLSPFARNNRLEIVDASSCGIESLPSHVMKNFTCLRELRLHDNNIDHIDGIKELKSLMILKLSGNLVRSMDKIISVSKYLSLRDLDLR